MKEILKTHANIINEKMEARRQEMRKVYKHIFNVNEIPKEKMKNPSPKEKLMLNK